MRLFVEVAQLLALKHRVPVARAEALVREAFWWVATETKEKGRCEVPGFGVFLKKSRAARRIVNVLDGAEMQLPETTEIRFRKARRFGK